MARVPVTPIGSPREQIIDDRAFTEQREDVLRLEERLRTERAKVHRGWGEQYVERVHQKGKMTTRERIARLIDPGTRIFEVGTFVNHGILFGKQESPAA